MKITLEKIIEAFEKLPNPNKCDRWEMIVPITNFEVVYNSELLPNEGMVTTYKLKFIRKVKEKPENKNAYEWVLEL